ncbi:MAG: hypothetical protein EBQ96_09710 [Proteobacteria bacterium]|nr:hypothetical protein [Pseudomonadota bacterium]
MRIALIIMTALFVCVSAPAWACKCTPDTDGSRAAGVLADPSISVLDVYVRAVNYKNGFSMLDLKARHSGSLMAQYVRAKFGGSSCDIRPVVNQTMTVLIKNESNGTYSLVGGCDHAAVMQHLKKGQ